MTYVQTKEHFKQTLLKFSQFWKNDIQNNSLSKVTFPQIEIEFGKFDFDSNLNLKSSKFLI